MTRQEMNDWKYSHPDPSPCAECGVMLPLRYLTIDHHPTPRREGGLDHEDNLRLACAPCNSAGGGKAPVSEETRKRMSESRKAAHARPGVSERISAAIKAALARPEVKAKRKATEAQPEVRAKRIAAATAAHARPEVKAKVISAMKAVHARPEVKAKRKATQAALRRRRLAAACHNDDSAAFKKLEGNYYNRRWRAGRVQLDTAQSLPKTLPQSYRMAMPWPCML